MPKRQEERYVIRPEDAARGWTVLKACIGALRFACRALRNDGAKPLQVVFGTYYEKRSDAANKYYWGVVIKMLCDHVGEEDKEAMHYDLKKELLEPIKRVNRLTGEEEEVLPSTARMPTDEFWAYVNACRDLAGRFFGLVIPDPKSHRDIYGWP